jgi:DNA-binding NtrC family response regulator
MPTLHILLAGGRENLRQNIALMLKQAEYRVSLAAALPEALARIDPERGCPDEVDILIADLDFASAETCRELLTACAAGRVSLPFLVIAEDVEEESEAALKAHGCLACITRPFEADLLLDTLGRALGRTPRRVRTDKNNKEARKPRATTA